MGRHACQCGTCTTRACCARAAVVAMRHAKPRGLSDVAMGLSPAMARTEPDGKAI